MHNLIEAVPEPRCLRVEKYEPHCAPFTLEAPGKAVSHGRRAYAEFLSKRLNPGFILNIKPARIDRACHEIPGHKEF